LSGRAAQVGAASYVGVASDADGCGAGLAAFRARPWTGFERPRRSGWRGLLCRRRKRGRRLRRGPRRLS